MQLQWARMDFKEVRSIGNVGKAANPWVAVNDSDRKQGSFVEHQPSQYERLFTRGQNTCSMCFAQGNTQSVSQWPKNIKVCLESARTICPKFKWACYWHSPPEFSILQFCNMWTQSILFKRKVVCGEFEWCCLKWMRPPWFISVSPQSKHMELLFGHRFKFSSEWPAILNSQIGVILKLYIILAKCTNIFMTII